MKNKNKVSILLFILIVLISIISINSLSAPTGVPSSFSAENSDGVLRTYNYVETQGNYYIYENTEVNGDTFKIYINIDTYEIEYFELNKQGTVLPNKVRVTESNKGNTPQISEAFKEKIQDLKAIQSFDITLTNAFDNPGTYTLNYLSQTPEDYVYESVDFYTKSSNKIWIYINKQTKEVSSYKFVNGENIVYNPPFDIKFPSGIINQAFDPSKASSGNFVSNPTELNLVPKPSSIPALFTAKILSKEVTFKYYTIAQSDGNDNYVYIAEKVTPADLWVYIYPDLNLGINKILAIDKSSSPAKIQEVFSINDLEFLEIQNAYQESYKKLNPETIKPLGAICDRDLPIKPYVGSKKLPTPHFIIENPLTAEKIYFSYFNEDANYYIYVSPNYVKPILGKLCADLVIYINKKTLQVEFFNFYQEKESSLKTKESIISNPIIPANEINIVFKKSLNLGLFLRELLEKFQNLKVPFDKKQVSYEELSETSLDNSISSKTLFERALGYMLLSATHRSSLNIAEQSNYLQKKDETEKSNKEAEVKTGAVIDSFSASVQPDGSVNFAVNVEIKNFNKDFTFNLELVASNDKKVSLKDDPSPLGKATKDNPYKTIRSAKFDLKRMQLNGIDPSLGFKSLTFYVYDNDKNQISKTVTLEKDSRPFKKTTVKYGEGTRINTVFSDTTETLLLLPKPLDAKDLSTFFYQYEITNKAGKKTLYPSSRISKTDIEKSLRVPYSSIGIEKESDVVSMVFKAYLNDETKDHIYQTPFYSGPSKPIVIPKNTAEKLKLIYENYNSDISSSVKEVNHNLITSQLIYGIMLQESGSDTKAVSPTGALGLMQFTFGTSCEYSKKCFNSDGKTEVDYDAFHNSDKTKYQNVFDNVYSCGVCAGKTQKNCNKENCAIFTEGLDDGRLEATKSIKAAAYLTKSNLDRYKGYKAQKELAIAAYNAGPTAVNNKIRSVERVQLDKRVLDFDAKKLNWDELKAAGFSPFVNSAGAGESVIGYVDKILGYEEQAKEFLDKK